MQIHDVSVRDRDLHADTGLEESDSTDDEVDEHGPNPPPPSPCVAGACAAADARLSTAQADLVAAQVCDRVHACMHACARVFVGVRVCMSWTLAGALHVQ